MKSLNQILENSNAIEMIAFSDLSKHAKTRKSQRGFDNEALEIAIDYGDEYLQKGGYHIYYLSKKSIQNNKYLKQNALKFEKYIGLTVILSMDFHVITCYKNKGLKNITKIYGKN